MSPIRLNLFGTLLVCALVLLPKGIAAAQSAPTADVSRQPPARFLEAVAPLLTPLDQALEISQALPVDPDFGGAVIVSEIIHHIAEDGSRLVVLHSIYRADSDAEAESLSDDTQSFRSASQKIHLALAQTISADGTRTPVRPNATLIQSPQREASQALYSDRRELVIIYPKMKPGTLTESIVVIEEDEMRVPGEFMTSSIWASGWPQGSRRVVIDLPAAMGERLRFSPLGTGTPVAVRSDPAPGRVRFELRQDRSEAYRYEVGRPPVSHAGPATWVTTLADWDAFAAWYRPLIQDRAKLAPALAAKVDAWTADANSEDEIIAELLERVSTDVRYTGLEFGISGLQPYDCNEVWENQYGDCKDKSNLLRAMLAHKGIKSYLTLLNTDHAGRIEKRSPDYRQFNHAILAIERADGSLQFCDPTIEFASPGLITPDDADREVLLIREDRAEFAHTPAASGGHLHYEFDLDLKPSREITGWMTLTCKGYYATSYASYFRKRDPHQLNGALAGFVASFFPSAEIIDSEIPSTDAWEPGEDYRVRAYFIAPGRKAPAGSGQLSLTFPQTSAIFPDLGDTRSRQAPFYGWADETSIDAKIRVPRELGSPSLPRPFGVDSSAVAGSAGWGFTAEQNTYRARLAFAVKKALLSPDEFKVAFGAVSSMRNWLSVPLIFDAGKALPDERESGALTVDNFPLMPTGNGQLNLLEQRFPSDGNRAMRRAALMKVLQFFPGDLRTRFAAETKLAELDWQDDKNAQAISRLEALLDSEASDAVDREELAWAEYVLAFGYRDLGEHGKAAGLLKDISENAAVSEYRRGWAGYQRLSILQATPSPDYAALADEAGILLDYDTEARPFLIALHCDFMTRSGKPGRLAERLAAIVRDRPENLVEIIALVSSVARGLPQPQANQLAAVIRSLPVDVGSPAADTLAAEMEHFAEELQVSASYAEIQRQLAAFIETNRPDNWQALAPADWPATQEEFAEQLELLERSREAATYQRMALEYLTRHTPDERFPYFLWRAAAWAEYAERAGSPLFSKPALPRLLDLCDLLPDTDDYFVEGRFLRARSLAQQRRFTEEAAVLRGLIEGSDLAEPFTLAATFRLGLALERQDKLDGAHARYVSLKPSCPEFPMANDALLRAALIDLERGQFQDAAALIDLLRQTKPEVLEDAENSRQIEALVALENPLAYWRASAKWWPRWEKLRDQLAGDEGFAATRVPAIGDLQMLGVVLRNALKAKDTAVFYDKLDLLMRSLRWSPDYLNDAGSSLSFLATTISPDNAAELREFVIHLAQNFPEPSAEGLRQLQLYQAISLIDSARPEDALGIIETFFDRPGANDQIYFTMVRLWAIAALRSDDAELEEPAGELEKVLASAGNDERRSQNVLHLAQLYHQLGRSDSEEALLVRELEHPAIKSDGEASARLSMRHRTLAREGSGGREFTAAVERWLAEHGPEWLTHCRPLDLDDSGIGGDLERALEQAASRYSVEQQIKLNVLAAKSARLGMDRRERAFDICFSQLLQDARTHKQARAMTTSVLDDGGFTRDIKQYVLYQALDDAVDQRRPGDVAFLLAQPALDRENPGLQDVRELYGRFAEMDFRSAASITETYRALSADQVSSVDLGGIMNCFTLLLELGELPAAEEIYRESSRWELAPGVRQTNAAIKLNLLKGLKIARRTLPTNEKLHATLAPLLDLTGIVEHEWMKRRRRFTEPSDLTIAQERALRLYQVSSKRYDHSDGRFWFDVAAAIQGPDSLGFAYKLLETYLAATGDDAARSSAAFFAPGIVDTDEPAVREQIQRIFQPYKELANSPMTRDAIRMYEIRSGFLRLGKEIDLGQAFASISHPAAAEIRTESEIIQLVSTGQIPQLKSYLERLSADTLLDEGLLGLTIPALELAGLQDEAELARETAIEKIPQLVASGWRTPADRAHARAYMLATRVERPDLIPQQLMPSLLRGAVKNERERLVLRMLHHRLHREWPEAEQAARTATEQFPTFYSFYFNHAEALYHQRKPAEAVEPLRVFIKYCPDEFEYSQAKRWLEEIEEQQQQQEKQTE